MSPKTTGTRMTSSWMETVPPRRAILTPGSWLLTSFLLLRFLVSTRSYKLRIFTVLLLLRRRLLLKRLHFRSRLQERLDENLLRRLLDRGYRLRNVRGNHHQQLRRTLVA